MGGGGGWVILFQPPMDATTFFLTYPRTDLTHDAVHDALVAIKPIIWARVAIEAHEDGTPHVHAIVRFGARVKTRSNMGIFDIMGRHPNVQVPRRIKDVLEYCSKAGNFKDYGTIPKFKTTTDKSDAYDECVQAATRHDRDALDRCAISAGLSKQWADHIWARHGSANTNTVLEPGQGTMCLQLSGLQFTGGSVAIIGPSGCGKTTWAKTVCPKPALWVRHIDDLRKLSTEHQCIIFDDMDFNHWPRTTQIHLVDQYDPSSINVRYGTVTIPAGMPRIFTGNVPMFTLDPAIDRRLQKVFIHSYTL